MRKLEVAIIAPSLDILGGHSVQAGALLEAWKADADVHAWLIPVNPVPPGVLRHARKIKYVRTVATQLTYLPLLTRQLMRADIVHIFSASYWSFLLAPLPAMLIARLCGRPVVLNYHSGEAPDHLARSRVARAAIAKADQCVVPSPYLAEVFGRFSLEATVVPNIVNLERFRFRERHSLRPRLLSSRNLSAPYNVACTLRAFRHIQDASPDASLTVVGAGPDARSLEQLARDLSLRHVTFLGRIEPADMPAIYADHDIYIQSPDIDNMPLSVLEAFASGLPVVSTDAGGVATMLQQGRLGLMAAPNDHRALAAHVQTLLSDPGKALEMARAAYASLETCSWTTVREKWLQIYRRALAGRPMPVAVTSV